MECRDGPRRGCPPQVVYRLLGDKNAVTVLFEEVAGRFMERPGGYTRIVRLANPRLGDNATRAILEFVGVRDRVVQKSEKPAFDDAPAENEAPTEEACYRGRSCRRRVQRRGGVLSRGDGRRNCGGRNSRVRRGRREERVVILSHAELLIVV